MMPTFPPLPLSFRTADSPRYGWKAGLSGRAFPRVAQVKPAPGMPCTTRKFASTIRALRELHVRPARCQDREPQWCTAIRGDQLLYPRDPRPGPSYSVSVHQRLSVSCAPLPGTSRFHGISAYTGCPRCAGAPRRPRSGSVLSLFRSLWTCRPLRPRGVYGLHLPSPSPIALAFAKSRLARHSQISRHPLQTRGEFRGSIGSLSLRPVHLLVPLADLTGHFNQPTGTFTPELSTSRSPSSPSGITTVVPQRFHRWDFHPLERQLASLQRLHSP
jgi:hypothetical protein